MLCQFPDCKKEAVYILVISPNREVFSCEEHSKGEEILERIKDEQ